MKIKQLPTLVILCLPCLLHGSPTEADNFVREATHGTPKTSSEDISSTTSPILSEEKFIQTEPDHRLHPHSVDPSHGFQSNIRSPPHDENHGPGGPQNPNPHGNPSQSNSPDSATPTKKAGIGRKVRDLAKRLGKSIANWYRTSPSLIARFLRASKDYLSPSKLKKSEAMKAAKAKNAKTGDVVAEAGATSKVEPEAPLTKGASKAEDVPKVNHPADENPKKGEHPSAVERPKGDDHER